MITEVATAADLAKLPTSLQAAMRGPQSYQGAPRFRQNIDKAEKKLALQAAVVQAVTERLISYDLGVQILVAQNAYGPKGKAAMKECVK